MTDQKVAIFTPYPFSDKTMTWDISSCHSYDTSLQADRPREEVERLKRIDREGSAQVEELLLRLGFNGLLLSGSAAGD
jgi:hypothetical protein